MTGRSAHEWDPNVSQAPDQLSPEDILESRLGDESRHLIEFVTFGHETELFVSKNPVGRYLVKKAEDELSEAVKQLLDLDSLRDIDARAAFSKAKVALKTLRWIDEAITAGREAEQAIQMRDVGEEQ